MVTLLYVLLAFNNFVPREMTEDVAWQYVRSRSDSYYLVDNLTYYDFDDLPVAYAYIFKSSKNEPLTVVCGARFTCSPIFEISDRIPNYFVTLDRAKTIAEKSLGYKVNLEKIYYTGPLDEFFCFSNGKQAILVNTYSLKSFDKETFLFKIQKPERDAKIESILKDKWQRYINLDYYYVRESGYVDSVPFIDWVYGCSPTAASMILWYWDPRGYGRLVDYFFTHWDNPEHEWNECANVNRELALRMYTDTLTGGTYISNIGPGIVTTCNTNNGYSFASQTSSQGGPWNQFHFSWIKAEIDAQRPCHWNVLHYQGDPNFNHSVTAVGYETSVDTFIRVHDTWTVSEPLWPLWTYANGYQSYDYVVTVVPGGSNPNNILLTFPQQAGIFIKNLKYQLKWTSFGSDIDHVKIWYSKGRDGLSYDSTYWSLINANVPNTGTYIWTIPNEDSALRINIAGLSATNYRYGADGTFTPFTPKAITDSSHIILFGHCPISGNVQDVVVIGNYAYLALGDNGIGIVDCADSSLPSLVNIVNIGGSPRALAYDNQYLYCITYNDSALKVLSLSNPATPSVIGSVRLSDQTLGLEVRNNIAYVACRMAGLRLVSVVNPANPVEVGYFNTSGQSYDVCIIHDTIAVVADGTKDLIFLKVSNPSSIESLLVFNTPGIPKGVWSGEYLFVGDGAYGVGIVDVSNPLHPESLTWYNTPGMAYAGFQYGSLLFIADGPSGIRMLNISNPSNPTEVGWLDSYGNANAIAVQSPSKIFLADGDDGLYLMGRAPLGIEDNKNTTILSSFKVFPNPFSSKIAIKFEFVDLVSEVSLQLYDVSGRRVKSFNSFLNNRNQVAEIQWNGTDDKGVLLPQGIYFIQLKSENILKTEKVILIR